ncbi:MAG: class I SAM-dependent methyltransferase [Candidatus Binatia bacterium]
MRMFDFGSNWEAFSEERVDGRRLASAVKSLQVLLQRETLEGSSFLDIGCGSGLFTIAASQLGAERAIGIDINSRCIAVSEQNRARLAPQSCLTFLQVSALDPVSLQKLGEFDIVYAWGSLHHTGAMWGAIRNVARQVALRGTFVLANYNKRVTSSIWAVVKWLYNHSPPIGRGLIAREFAGIIYVAKLAVTHQNLLDRKRSIDFWYDVIDRVGGYPYEYSQL